MGPALLLVPLVAVLAALAGRALAGAPAILLALVLGSAAAAALGRTQADRVRALAEAVNGWLRHRRIPHVTVPGGAAWHELEVAVNAVGAAYQRRGEKLRRERPWRRELVDSLVGPALLFAADGRLVAANGEAGELLNLPAPSQRPTLVQALGNATLAEAARRALAGRERIEVDATLTDRELQAVCSVVGEEVLVLLTDRTHQRRIAEVRRDFVINASHELKSPAAAIQTLTDALSVVVDRDSERVPAVAERLRMESERLVRIVDDLLDLSRLEPAGQLETVAVDLAALVRSVVAEVDVRAAANDVRIEVDVPDDASVAGVAGDLRLIVENLVGNAVRYNRPGGGVSVRIRPVDGAHELVVADTGIGIPQQDLPRIFERFYRVDEARSRETGGTGLGLSIVRHAIERHGGTVKVDSLLGEGTTFTVRLPVSATVR
jgi:signal transduction histidine kinase